METNHAKGAALSILVLSIILMVISLGVYIGYQNASLRLTVSLPFANWSGITDVYQNGLADIPSNATAYARVFRAAWCDKYSPRLNVVPANRSDMCACLNNNTARFLVGPNTNASRNDFSNSGKACFRKRPVWDVWDCGDYCVFHPLVISFYINAIMFLFAFDYLCRYVWFEDWVLEKDEKNKYTHKQNRKYICLLPVVIMMGIIAAIARQSSIIYLFTFVAVPIFTISSINEGREYFMTYVWFYYTFALPTITCYVAASSTVRDSNGLLVYTGLGYLIALLGQRVFWSYSYDEERNGLGKYIRSFIWISILGLVTGLSILVYINWFPSSPAWSTSISVICAVIYLLVPVLEIFKPYTTNSDLSNLYILQISMMMIANVWLLVSTARDSAM
jgi:hypothetical protein